MMRTMIRTLLVTGAAVGVLGAAFRRTFHLGADWESAWPIAMWFWHAAWNDKEKPR